jgi:hypothetical protein
MRPPNRDHAADRILVDWFFEDHERTEVGERGVEKAPIRSTYLLRTWDFLNGRFERFGRIEKSITCL